MKKLFTTLVAIFAITQFSYAQWQDGTNIYNTNSGNVGIGTTSPVGKLNVYGGGVFSKGAVASSGIHISEAGGIDNIAQMSFGYTNNGTATYAPGAIGYIVTNASGFDNGALYFATRSVTTDAAPIERMRIDAFGRVGLGTTSPEKQLDVNGDARILGTNKLYLGPPTFEATLGYNGNGNLDITPRSGYNTIFTTGNVGIGTSSPSLPLEVEGTIYSATPRSNTVTIGTSPVNNSNYNFIGYQGYWGLRTATNTSYNLDVYNGGSPINAMTVLQSGNVGIGTTTPHETLSVNGNIRSKQVKVESINWPDYVFKSNYVLPSLSEVKSYIDKYQHLPDMPSEAEVAKDGLNLGEINKLLTKKVE
jgi:hypothetical protein